MKVCVGLPASFPFFSAVAAEMGAPTLVSANALFRHKNGTFRSPTGLFAEPPRLDSAGFVAMLLYKGYPWSREAHVEIAGAYPWAWWAARDYCCEPEIAADRFEVIRRVLNTVDEYKRCVEEAERQGASFPMPVLQGWWPEDYELCAKLLGYLPNLVGIGSVCRRPLKGLLAIVDHLDRILPKHVRLHLFGVKSAGVQALWGHPRIESVDSMAWDFHAAKVAMARRRLDKSFSCTLEFRAQCMREWYWKQTRPHQESVNAFSAAV